MKVTLHTVPCSKIPQVTFISWIPGSAVSYLGDGASIPGGADRMHYFKNVVAAPDASFTAGKLDFGGMRHGQVRSAFASFSQSRCYSLI